MKVKQSRNRDNKILSLNSDNDSESDDDDPLCVDKVKQVDEDFKKLFTKSDNSNPESKPDTRANSKDGTPDIEMEFDDQHSTIKIQPPPLQDSKEYYNSTQRMTEAMIQNPQFQIFSIDKEEKESMRTSMKSIQEESQRMSLDSIKIINQVSNQVENEALEMDRSHSQTPISASYAPETPYPQTDEPTIPTPNRGTPPDGAPENEFRNLHREDQGETPDSIP